MSEPKFKVGQLVKWDGVPIGPKPNSGTILAVEKQNHPDVKKAFPNYSDWYYQMDVEGKPWVVEDLVSDVAPIPDQGGK